MTHDTTPVRGHEWEHSETGERRTIINAYSDGVTYWRDDSKTSRITFDWHAWAANARRVG